MDRVGLSPANARRDSGASRELAKRVAFAVDDLTPARSGAVVLAYHRVGQRTESEVDLSTESFRRQIAHLTADLRVFSLDSFLAANRDDGTSAPIENRGDGIVLTFDDGTADFVDVVLPILVEYAVPATIYVATAFIDTGRSFPQDGRPASWAGLREAVSTGLVSVGAHTHDHILLDRCTRAAAADQLDRSNARIEDELGVTPIHFAYPKAVLARPEVEALIESRYESAALARTRPNPIGSTNPHRLFRSPIQVRDGWEGFRRKIAGGMSFEDDVRGLINRYRYRGKTT